MKPNVYIFATCDTKGDEAAFVREKLRASGASVTLVDCGAGPPRVAVDIERSEVFERAGTVVPGTEGDRGQAVNAAALGASRLCRAAYEAGRIDGVFGLGGSAGTTIGTAAMRELPLGVPKVMVSTLASGPVRTYVRDKDITMINSVVDIAGLNRITRAVLGNASAALAGMLTARGASTENAVDSDRPLVAATMFGVTTPCVERAREVLERAGYEVLVFHATGNGGQALESLTRDGVFEGVLDITTTELADELVGGVLSAGPERLTACTETGTPQVVSVGATDMVNFLDRASVPERYTHRKLHEHNANVTLMRTTAEECRVLGNEIGSKLARATGPTRILLPLRGVSAIDSEGADFEDLDARRELFDAVHASCGTIKCVDLDYHINDPEFAEAAAAALLELMREKR